MCPLIFPHQLQKERGRNPAHLASPSGGMVLEVCGGTRRCCRHMEDARSRRRDGPGGAGLTLQRLLGRHLPGPRGRTGSGTGELRQKGSAGSSAGFLGVYSRHRVFAEAETGTQVSSGLLALQVRFKPWVYGYSSSLRTPSPALPFSFISCGVEASQEGCASPHCFWGAEGLEVWGMGSAWSLLVWLTAAVMEVAACWGCGQSRCRWPRLSWEHRSPQCCSVKSHPQR